MGVFSIGGDGIILFFFCTWHPNILEYSIHTLHHSPAWCATSGFGEQYEISPPWRDHWTYRCSRLHWQGECGGLWSSLHGLKPFHLVYLRQLQSIVGFYLNQTYLAPWLLTQQCLMYTVSIPSPSQIYRPRKMFDNVLQMKLLIILHLYLEPTHSSRTSCDMDITTWRHAHALWQKNNIKTHIS